MRPRLTTCCDNQGYILIPTVILIAAIAAIALFNSQQSLMNLQLANNEFDSSQAEYVAQAGMHHAIQQAGRQGCGPFNDISNTSLGDHNYSASLNTNQGATNNYTRTVDQDNWIQSDSPSNNNGNSSPLKLNTQSGKDYRPMYRFDLFSGLDPVPAGSTILSAVAWFYVVKEHPQGEVTIHRLAADWAEDTATWNNVEPFMQDPVIATIPPQPLAGQWVSVNLTTQVQAWVNGQDNYGIMLRSSIEGIDTEYSSRDSSNAPYLEVISGDLPGANASINVTGTLANGSSHNLTRQNILLQQLPDFQRVYQPGANKTEDSWLKEGETSETYGIDNRLEIDDDNRRTIIRFDLNDALPKGAILTSATLGLYSDRVDNNGKIEAFGLQRDWVEGDCNEGCGVNWATYDGSNNWDTPGGDADAEASAQVNVNASNTWYSLDISDIARQWSSGERQNYGLLLKGDNGLDMRINSSDHSDSWTHPRLVLSYTCECGQSCLLPQGSGQIAYIFGEPSAGQIHPQDQIKIAFMQAWGYDVDTFEDSSLGPTSPNREIYNVVYISNTVDPAEVDDEFTNDYIGIVSDEYELLIELGIADSAWTQSDTGVNIIDSSHFITSPFAPGALQIYSLPMEILSVGGTKADGLEELARNNSRGSLSVLNEGAQTLGFGSAAGRRVSLPFGRHAETTDNGTNFNWNYLNSNGLLLVQRALEWSKAKRCNDDDYRDNFDTVAFNNNDGSVNFSNNWQEEDGDQAGPAGGNLRITAGELELDDRPQEDGPVARRHFNLDGADTATLSFDFRLGDNTDAGADKAFLDIKTDVGNWTQLVDFSQWSGGFSDRLIFNISPFISPDTRIRFRITQGYDKNKEDLYIDNLRIGVCGTLN